MSTVQQPITFFDTLNGWLNWTGQKTKFALETTKESTGLPWWTTITSLTFGVRLIIFPLRLRAWWNGKMMKMTVEYCNKEIAPKLREYYQKNSSDPKIRAELFKQEMLKAHSDALKSMNLSPWKSLSPLPVSIPLFLSVAGGLRMVDFGGEGLGRIWKDFGVAEPISAVPVFISNLLYIEYSRRKRSVVSKGSKSSNDAIPSIPTDKFLRRNLPFLLGHTVNFFSLFLLSQVPSAVNLFLFTSSLFSLAESKYLDVREADRRGILSKEFGELLMRRKMNKK